MSYANAANAYRRTQAEAGTPLELVVMLYDGALRFLTQASEAMAARDIPRRHKALDNTLAIIGHLQSTLDTERGGALAEELDRLYTYMSSRLLEGAARNDAAALTEVSRLLSSLRDAWHTIASSPVPPPPATLGGPAEARP
jgi:flagellar secretion chaperone FliS